LDDQDRFKNLQSQIDKLAATQLKQDAQAVALQQEFQQLKFIKRAKLETMEKKLAMLEEKVDIKVLRRLELHEKNCNDRLRGLKRDME